jgi:hypothetical protein
MTAAQNPSASFVITHGLTGKPIAETPTGISLKDKTFATKKELEQFVAEHWTDAVFTAEDPR